MSGGLPFPASRMSFPSSTVMVALAAAALLSGCGLLPVQNPPAPISEALVEPIGETAGEPLTMPPVPPLVQPEGQEAPKKPHREVTRPKPVQRPESPTPPPPPPPPLVATSPIERSQIHALLDSEVARRNGKVVGRAVDMVVDASGKPREMIVNLQGFMGIGDRKVSFPWSVFRFTPGGKQEPIVLDVPAGELPAAARPKAVPLSGSAAASPATRLPMLDSDVERPNGTKIGRVIDVLIDRGAQPQAVVLDLGGLVNTERRSIVASWGALRFVTRDKALHPQLDLNDAQIKAAPPYAADKPIVVVSPPPAAAPASPASAAR
ncbi:PRC-barrel domain-containing protein [Burkholderia vietnamiensis]